MAKAKYDAIRSGSLDVGGLFVDTRQIYFDARSNAAEFDTPQLRVDAMFVVVEMVGRLITEISVLRSQITKGTDGLVAFDQDLAGLRARYSGLYRPFFEDMPPVSGWQVEEWVTFVQELEGPILLHDKKTCAQGWEFEFIAPPCEGPDLLTALSLLRQTGAALKLQQDLVESIWGLADLRIGELLEFYGDQAAQLGSKVKAAFGQLARDVRDYVIPPKVQSGIGWGVALLLGAVGIGGAVALNNMTKKRSTQ